MTSSRVGSEMCIRDSEIGSLGRWRGGSGTGAGKCALAAASCSDGGERRTSRGGVRDRFVGLAAWRRVGWRAN
eukprot:3261755-Prorocentrum_lima.AAC.1